MVDLMSLDPNQLRRCLAAISACNQNPAKISARRGSPRSRLVEVLVVALSLTLSTFAGEAIMRVAAPQPVLLLEPPGLYIADEAMGYRHRPGYRGFLANVVEYNTRVEINELGLRGPPVRNEPDGARIVMLGDSMVFGQGVEADQSIAGRLQARLNEYGLRVEVLNAGVRGYGTIHEAAWLRTYGAQLAPKIVVLGVFLGNDIQDNATPMQDSGGMLLPPQTWHTPLTRYLFTHSHLYRALRAAWLNLTLRAGAEQMAYLTANYGDANAAKAERVTAQALDEVVHVTQELNAALIALLIPDGLQVEPTRAGEFDEIRRSNPELHLDLTRPNRVFTKLLSERDIPTVDLTPAFKAQVKEAAPLYLPLDGHLNASGHQFAADLLAPRVEVLLRRSVKSNPRLTH
jgi:lysophospholipase L1-like esterase